MKKLLTLFIAVFAIGGISVSAHDIGYGMTHNHYDYVIVAHVEDFNEQTIDLTVVKHIISPISCGDNKGSHIPPKRMTVKMRDKQIYEELYSRTYGILKQGAQNVVAVIDKEDDGYRLIRLFEADSDDYRTLRIIGPLQPDEDIISGDDAAFNDFINSNGKYCDHALQGFPNADGGYKEEVTRQYKGESTVIYTTDKGYIAARTAEDVKEANSLNFIKVLAGMAAGILLLCIIIFIIAKTIKIKKR